MSEQRILTPPELERRLRETVAREASAEVLPDWCSPYSNVSKHEEVGRSLMRRLKRAAGRLEQIPAGDWQALYDFCAENANLFANLGRMSESKHACGLLHCALVGGYVHVIEDGVLYSTTGRYERLVRA
jgi:hypothetical protein